jgi:hypothetical protein
MQNILMDSLITSKSIHHNLHTTPKLNGIRYEMVAEAQTADYLFSDALHTLWVAAGTLPTAKRTAWMKQPVVRLSTSAQSQLQDLLANFVLEEAQVAFEGSDNSRYSISFDTTRTFLDSKLEDDLKYRLGIQEYYVGKAEFKLIFSFNRQSSRQTRAREMILRSKSLPVRLVRRLVG